MIAAALLAGCSKEERKSEELGRDMADRIKQPIEDARAGSEKAQETRAVEIPK